MTQSTSQLGFNATDRKMFANLRIPDELLSRAGVRRVSDAEARLDFGIKGAVTKDMSGIVYPYYHLKTGRRVTARVRRDSSETDGNGKPQNKYISAYGDSKHLFFSPGAGQQLEDPEASVALVESEKSGLALTAWADRRQQKIVPVAMGGCWGYRGRIGKRTNSHGERVDEVGVLSDLDCVNGRRVYVLLDANAESNSKVKKARNALVRELKRRNCKVLICHLPQVDGVNGPDDLIAVCGDEAMKQVFASASAGRLTYDYAGGYFELSEERGVEYMPPPDRDGNPRPRQWLCAPLEVIALTRDNRNGSWGRYLEWKDRDGQLHRLALPLELLRRDGGTEALCLLESEGLTIGSGKGVKDLVAAYIRIWPTDYRARCVERPGWANTSNGCPVYVLPSEAVGAAHEPIVYQSAHSVAPAFSSCGTTEEWKQNNAALAAGNSRLMFALSCAFAGPVLEIADEQSGGFHLRGNSSIGKSTCLELAASVWGDPQKYCRTWRTTTSGLEGVATIHNDGFLALDELAQVDPKEAGAVCYLLSNSMGKSRARRDGLARPIATWRLIFLSAGEPSLAQHMKAAGQRATAGQELRMAEIDADAGNTMGILEKLHDFATPLAMIETLRESTRKYHGAIGHLYLQHLVADRAKASAKLAEWLTTGINKFVADYADPQASGQIKRVTRRFALVAMAGELATKYGLTGWQQGEATKAAAACLLSWMNVFGDRGVREEQQLLEQVRSFFEANGASRFENMDGDDGQRIINRAGFYRVTETELTMSGDEVPKKGGLREYVVLPQAFRNELCAGFDFRFAVRALKAHEWLIPGTDKSAQSLRLPGIGKTRAYVISAKLWEDGA